MALSALPELESTASVLGYLVPVTLSSVLQFWAVRGLPRGARGPWLTVGAGTALFVIGEYVSAAYTLAGSDRWPTPGDACYVLALLVVAVGLHRVNRRRT